ncbi:hypothetical protein [Pseudonocardia dioxanivorans]|uniref:hypothetical protein n=1 Tax=Pseudonocardia dioxanivorans TaxID=240495 RepID=UPI000CD14B11|nr:hypothetical protein [Pseudonocardia dioxanivorans]
MTAPEDPDAWVHDAFALDGPHTPESVTAAAAAVAELVRYLNRATMTVRLPAPELASTLRNLGVAAARLPQLIDQLHASATRLDEHGEPYSDTDRLDVNELRAQLGRHLGDVRVKSDVEGLRLALDGAASAAGHIGHRYDPASDPEVPANP